MDNVAIRYTKTHEWAKQIEALIVRIGISAHGIEELGTIQFIDLPEPGTVIRAEEGFAQIESTKVTSDLYAPLDGEVITINKAVTKNIHLINSEPEERGWLVDVRITDVKLFLALMTQDQYDRYINKAE